MKNFNKPRTSENPEVEGMRTTAMFGQFSRPKSPKEFRKIDEIFRSAQPTTEISKYLFSELAVDPRENQYLDPELKQPWTHSKM